jgi:hypothetical protein
MKIVLLVGHIGISDTMLNDTVLDVVFYSGSNFRNAK